MIEEILKYAKRGLEDALEFGYNDMAVMFWEEIIKLLEKQIPKKPNRFEGYTCRECNGRLARQTDLVNQMYCHHCGQKMKWGE